jgi:hypothetical protein
MADWSVSPINNNHDLLLVFMGMFFMWWGRSFYYLYIKKRTDKEK